MSLVSWLRHRLVLLPMYKLTASVQAMTVGGMTMATEHVADNSTVRRWRLGTISHRDFVGQTNLDLSGKIYYVLLIVVRHFDAQRIRPTILFGFISCVLGTLPG